MREFILEPRPGYDTEDAIENTDLENSEIVVYEYGVYQYSYPVTPDTMRIFKPKPTPQYRREQKLVMREGEKSLKKPIPADKLTTDVNPFFQIIHKIVKPRERASLEEIQRSLIHDYRVFTESPDDLYIIQQIVKRMHEDGILLIDRGSYRVGISLGVGQRLLDFEYGYDPFEIQIVGLVKGKGLVSNKEIHDMILKGLRWTERGELVQDYIRRLLERENIEQVGDYYRFIKPLKRITGEKDKKRVE